MATGNTTPATARNTCKHPGCAELAAPASGPGRPPEYCEGRGHTKVTAWRERRRLAAVEGRHHSTRPTPTARSPWPRLTGAELLRSLRAEADRISGIAAGCCEAVETLTDPTAAEAEVEAVRAAAEQRAAAAEARAAAAEQRAAEADQWRAEADAAAEEMAAQMDRRPGPRRRPKPRARRRRRPGHHDRSGPPGRRQRIAAAEADRDAAIAQARADAAAGQRRRGRAGPGPRTRPRRQNSRPARPAGNRPRPGRRATPPAPRPAGSAPTRRRC